MIDAIHVLFWVSVNILVGHSILFFIDQKKILTTIEKIGLSFLLGIGTVSLEMFVLGLAGFRFGIGVILLPWVMLAAYNGIFLKYSPDDIKNIKVPQPSSAGEKALFSIISFQVLYVFFRALIRPIESYDSVAIHSLKGKILYLAGTVPNNFFAIIGGHFHGAHADYPLMLPLAETSFYVFLNSFNDLLVKWIFPLSLLAFVFVFYSFMKKVHKARLPALLFTFLLVSIAHFANYATIASPDLYMGMYFCIALVYLYFWFNEPGKKVYLTVSFLFSLLSLWTKNEGLLLVGINVLLLIVYAVRNRQEIPRAVLYIIDISVAAFVWMSYKSMHGLVNENFSFAMVNWKNLVSGLYKIPIIFYEYQKHLFGFKKWNIIWVIMLFFFIFRGRESFSHNISYVTSAIILFFLAYTVVYLFSVVEIRFFLRTTASRFLLHILPVTVFWIAYRSRKLIREIAE